MLRIGFARPDVPLLTIAAGTPAGASRSHRALRRLLATAGVVPTTPAAAATATQWHDLAVALLHAQVTPAGQLTPSRSR
jgi:hypothetical protein